MTTKISGTGFKHQYVDYIWPPIEASCEVSGINYVQRQILD